MKVAIITIWHCYNYGAEMQAYVTYKALCSLGHDVQLIEFYLKDDIPVVKRFLAYTIDSISPQRRKFEKFWKLFTPCRTKRYNSINELRNNPPRADIYLVGSDQVWNEAITKEQAPAFFLDFGEDNIQRVSFSSSFGVSAWCGSESLTNIAHKRLSGFSHVSCREKTGINILKETFHLQSVVNTLDPTLLYKDYPEITGRIIDNNAVVFYPLSADDDSLGQIARKVASHLGLDVINANPYTIVPKTSIIWNRNSIQDWLRCIGGARFVITQSFHGLVFSLLFHREFAILNLTGNGKQSRILDLLSSIGLEDRFFTNESSLLDSEILHSNIDYRKVDLKLDELRAESWDYLKGIFD